MRCFTENFPHHKVEESGTHKSAKTNAVETQRKRMRGNCARGVTAGKTQRSLRTQQQQRQYTAFCLKTD